MTFGMLSICKIPSCLTANNYYHCYLYYCFYSNYYCITSSTTITTTTTPTTSTTTATAPDHLILFEKRKNLHIWPNHLQISCFVKIVLFYCFGFTLKLEFNSEYHILEHKLSKQMLFSGRRKKKLKVTTIHWLCHNRIHPVCSLWCQWTCQVVSLIIVPVLCTVCQCYPLSTKAGLSGQSFSRVSTGKIYIPVFSWLLHV